MNAKLYKHTPTMTLIVSLVISTISGTITHATADGPDFWRITSTSAAKRISIHTSPSTRSPTAGTVPHNARCIEWTECWGGSANRDCAMIPAKHCSPFSKLPTRWCHITYNNISGWIAAVLLEEDADCNSDTGEKVAKPLKP